MKRVLVLRSVRNEMKSMGYMEVSTSRYYEHEDRIYCFLVPKEDVATLKEIVDVYDVE